MCLFFDLEVSAIEAAEDFVIDYHHSLPLPRIEDSIFMRNMN